MSDPAPRPGLVIGALLSVQFLFGLQYVVIKIALDEGLDPLEWAAVRAVCATVLLAATAQAFRCPFPTDRNTVWRLAGCAVLGMVINQVCFVIGLTYTTPGQSALINVSIPVTALVFAWILRTERPDLARSIGVAAAAGGLALMLSGGLQDDWRTGNWFTFANALSFGLFLVVSRGVYRRIHPYAGTAVLFVFGTIGICAIAATGWLAGWWTPDTPWSTLSASAWAAMIYTVLGATVGTYALNAFALRRADSSIVGFFIFLQPLIATTLSWLRGGEQPGWRFWVAAALVAVGVFIVLGRARMLRVRARNAAADVLPKN